MLIAKQLRKENIVEYLLYMWQIEDLLRAANLDLQIVNQQVVEKYETDASTQKEIFEWYESLIDMLRRENRQMSGHLQLNENVMSEIVEFHTLMLQTGKDAGYSAKFYHILPLIAQLRENQKNSETSDIEICLNFLYGMMLLKMQNREISPETQAARTEIIKFLILLAHNYKKYREEDDFFEKN